LINLYFNNMDDSDYGDGKELEFIF